MALLGIASGALKIGQKIFQGIKNRKEKKVEKKAQALVDAQNKQATVNEKIGAVFASMGGGQGTQAISASGNLLAGIKAAFSPNKDIAAFQPVSGANAVAKQNADAAGGGGMNPMFLLLGAGLLILLIFKKR